MKRNKGFTLTELLAVIIILGIIITIVTRSVISNMNESKKRVRFLAAKEIVEMADAYMTINGKNEVEVSVLIDEDYIEQDATNPKTSKNGGDFTDQRVSKDSDSVLQADYEEQSCGSSGCYKFDGYIYYLN